MITDTMSDTMTVAEFAKAVGVTERTVGRWINPKTPDEEPLVRAEWSTTDRRVRAIPRSELERFRAARQNAEQRAYVAGAAAGMLQAEWRIGYRSSARAIAAVGGDLARHLEAVGPEHESEDCRECVAAIMSLSDGVEAARQYATVRTLANEISNKVVEAGLAADRLSAALRADN